MSRRSLLVLAAATFVYVTAETVPVGLLPQIAQGLSVSEADVGLLLTTYAGVAAISCIPLTALTMRVPRGPLLAGLVAVYAVSQGLATFAPTFTILIVSRLLCALAHGVFWSILAPAAARLAPPGQAGRATSLVFSGNLVAIVLGVPLATALGQLLGWRVAFGALSVAGGLSAVALLLVLPPLPALARDRATKVAARLRAAATIVTSPPVAVLCAVTAILIIGQFAAYTYLAPLVRRDAGLSGLGLTALLLGYGLLGLLGNILAGRLIDRHPGRVLIGAVLTIAVSLVVLAAGTGAVLTIVAVLAWGAGFGAVPVGLQSTVLRIAPRAQDAASAVYVVAFQIGIGGGALLGDRLVVGGALVLLPVVGGTLAAVAAAVALTSQRAFPLRTGG